MKINAAFVATFITLSSTAQAQQAEPYRLGVQDRLRIHVHEWPTLTGEFVVGYGGALVLPLIGAIAADGLEPTELANEIANRLRENAGLSKAPETTVDIAQYRPFYILGGVERPGEYSYRPGMLVVNAVAIAGGVYRPPRTSDWGFERDAITGRGDLRIARVRRDEIRAKELRLKAEAEGLEVFPSIPADFPPGALKFANDERGLFSARLERHRNHYVALGKTIELVEGEIKSLQDQIVSARKQEESVAKELEDTRGLVARSVIPAPRILPIERTLAQIEREKKELDTAIMRARQQINTYRTQRDGLKDERRSLAFSDLQSLELQRQELDERIETAERLISGSDLMLGGQGNSGDNDRGAAFVIIRKKDGAPIEMSAIETTTLQPGDIVKVFRPQDTNSQRQSTVRREIRGLPATVAEGK
jgi:protein involved in polysaccharide export with SLBB domain